MNVCIGGVAPMKRATNSRGATSVYFKEGQLERIQTVAEEQGLSTSTFIRVATLQKLRQEEENQDPRRREA